METLESIIAQIPPSGDITIQSIRISYYGIMAGVALSVLYYLTKSVVVDILLYFVYPLTYSMHVVFGPTLREKSTLENATEMLSASKPNKDLYYATAMWAYGAIVNMVCNIAHRLFGLGKETISGGKMADITKILVIMISSIMTIPNGSVFYKLIRKSLNLKK